MGVLVLVLVFGFGFGFGVGDWVGVGGALQLLGKGVFVLCPSVRHALRLVTNEKCASTGSEG